MRNLITRLRDLFGDPFAHVDDPSAVDLSDYLATMRHPAPDPEPVQ